MCSFRKLSVNAKSCLFSTFQTAFNPDTQNYGQRNAEIIVRRSTKDRAGESGEKILLLPQSPDVISSNYITSLCFCFLKY